MSALFRNLLKAAPITLLTLAFCLLGAKTPFTFLIWASAALGLCALSFYQRPPSSRKLFTPFLITILVCLGIAQAASLDPSVSFPWTVQGIVFVLVWLLLKRQSVDAGSERIFWRMLMGLGLASLLWTIWQCFQGVDLVGTRRIYGFLPSNPSFNALWLASLSIALIGRAFRGPIGREEKIGLVLAAAMALFIIVSPARTRSAPLAWGIGFLYLLSTRYSWKKIALGGGLAAILLFVLLPINFLEAHARFLPGKYKEPNYRSQIWRIAVQAMRDRPLTGYGLGNFEIAYQKHSFPVAEELVHYARTTQFAHNEFLQVASDMGALALVLALNIVFLLFNAPIHENLVRQRSAKAALVVLLADALFNPSWHVPFLFLLTLVWSARLISPNLRENLQNTPASRLGWIRAGWLLVFAALEASLIYGGMRAQWADQKNWAAILRWNSHDAAAWQALGDQMPPSSRAVMAYARAVQLAPDQPYYRESLAAALEYSPHPEDLQHSLQEYAIALQQAPARVINAVSIGRLLYRQNHAAEALPWFERALQLEPNYWEAYLWTARSLYKTGKKKDAIGLLRTLETRHKELKDRQAAMLRALTYRPSGYEQRILAYDPVVVQETLRGFLSGK